MLNQVICVGRVANQPEKIATKDGLILSLSIPRNYKNAEGIYETDFIDVIVNGNMADNCAEYIHKGDIVGVKGHLQSVDLEVCGNKVYINGEPRKAIEVIAEKVTFLSSKKSEEREDEE